MPFDDPDLLESGRVLFAGPCDFVLGVQTLDQLPEADRVEIAFAGRSNVGKSSLLNAVTGRTSLARVSQQPGHTRQLNFFDLGGRAYLVDMPGYGYAEAPKSVKEEWQRSMFAYLRGRASLARVMLLIDAKVGAKASDLEVMELLDRAAVTYQLVLTKGDALKPAALPRQVEAMEKLARTHAAAFAEVLATSSAKGEGIPELRAALAGLALG